MERILTREEIAELVSAVQHGEIEVDLETSASPDSPSIIDFNLIRAHGGSIRRLPNVDIVLDAFAQNYGISLTNCLQRSVSIKRTAIDRADFHSFQQDLSGRGSIGIIRLDPLRWGGLVIFDEDLSFFLVENLLGGSGEDRLTIPDRSLTAIERHVVGRTMADACPDLDKAFRSLVALNATLVKVESNPRLVNIVAPDAMLMVARFSIAIGSVNGEMTLAIPHASFEPLLDKLKEGVSPFVKGREGVWEPHVKGELEQMEAWMAVELGTVGLKVRDILNLQVGDIVEIGREPSAPVNVVIEGKAKLAGQVGVRNGKKSVRITGRINNGVNHGK